MGDSFNQDGPITLDAMLVGLNNRDDDQLSGSESEIEFMDDIIPPENDVPPKKESSIDPERMFDLKLQAVCFTCGICQDLMIQPTTITCQHTYCYSCLEELIKNNKRRHEKNLCPVCKEVFLLPKSTAKNIIIDDIIEKMLPDNMKQARHREFVKRGMMEEVRREVRDELLPVMLRRADYYVPGAHGNPIPVINPLHPIRLENLIRPNTQDPFPNLANHANPANPGNLNYEIIDRAVRLIDSRTFRWSIIAIAGIMTGYVVSSGYNLIKNIIS